MVFCISTTSLTNSGYRPDISVEPIDGALAGSELKAIERWYRGRNDLGSWWSGRGLKRQIGKRGFYNRPTRIGAAHIRASAFNGTLRRGVSCLKAAANADGTADGGRDRSLHNVSEVRLFLRPSAFCTEQWAGLPSPSCRVRLPRSQRRSIPTAC
jgi:hypothetical protein